MKTINLLLQLSLALGLCVLRTTCTKLSNVERPTEFDPGTRIVGGEDAKEGQFPYQVALRTGLGAYTKHYCGGSIISQRFILTAGVCTLNLNGFPEFVHVVVGRFHVNDGGLTLEVDKIRHHKYYMPYVSQYDIALIRTRQDIVFTNKIKAIALPKTDLPIEGAPVIFSGWGKEKYPGDNPFAYILQFTKSTAIRLEACKKAFDGYGDAFHLYFGNVCTKKAKNVGACYGDAGGPLVDITNPEEPILVGIYSWGVKCGQDKYPDVFTRVYPFLKWIEEMMRELSHS